MMARSAAGRWAVVICVLPFLLGAATAAVHAQSRKPTVKEVAAIRDCAKKHETDLDEVERVSVQPGRNAMHGKAGRPIQRRHGRLLSPRRGNLGRSPQRELQRASPPILMRSKRQNCATCSAPGSYTVTARVASITRKSRARWLGRWAPPATARRAVLLKFFSGL